MNLHRSGVCLVACILVALAVAAGTEGQVLLEVENSTIRISLDQAKGQFEIRNTTLAHSNVATGRASRQGAVKARRVVVEDAAFGKGRALEVTHGDGRVDRIMLFEGVPFALFQTTLRNSGAEAVTVKEVSTFSLHVSGTLTFGTAGLKAPDENPGSYSYLAVVYPTTRAGVVMGWLTHNRGSGVLFTKLEEQMVRVDARLDYGSLRIDAGASEECEILAVGSFDDARLGLEAYADAVAKKHAIKLPAQPAGYCTWYSDRFGGASDEVHLAELAAFGAKHLKPYGFGYVQIDDKWQIGRRREGPSKDFTGHNPRGPYPSGMKKAADNVRAQGLVAGLWFMPFAGDHEDPLFAPHLDWFVKGPDGRPFETRWGGTCLDMTHPGAREHLRSITQRISHDWGYKFFKLDGLWTGTGTRIMYVNDGYKDDAIGESVLHDPSQTHMEAYRSGLKLVREAAGKDVFILGCNLSQNMRTLGASFGLVDAMRVGPDNNSSWPRLVRGPQHGSRRYFLHGRVWYNDPDPVYVRKTMPLEHARLIASWVAISGQLYANSDWLPDLPAERLEILKKTMAGHGLLPRPVDLFENDPARVWTLTDQRRAVRRDVVALYNWNSSLAEILEPIEKVGLKKGIEYVGFDYWANAFVAPFRDRLKMIVPKESCRIIAVAPVMGRPQVVSTSRHVTQGMMDVLEEKWELGDDTLTGRSEVIGGDVYELRIAAMGARKDTGWAIVSADVSELDKEAGAKVSSRQDGVFVRVRIESPDSRAVRWWVQFRPVQMMDEPVATVKNVVAKADWADGVKLSWTPAKTEGVIYRISRNGNRGFTTVSPEWVDDAVVRAAGTYNYTVEAVDWKGRASEPVHLQVEVPTKPK